MNQAGARGFADSTRDWAADLSVQPYQRDQPGFSSHEAPPGLPLPASGPRPPPPLEGYSAATAPPPLAGYGAWEQQGPVQPSASSSSRPAQPAASSSMEPSSQSNAPPLDSSAFPSVGEAFGFEKQRAPPPSQPPPPAPLPPEPNPSLLQGWGATEEEPQSRTALPFIASLGNFNKDDPMYHTRIDVSPDLSPMKGFSQSFGAAASSAGARLKISTHPDAEVEAQFGPHTPLRDRDPEGYLREQMQHHQDALHSGHESGFVTFSEADAHFKNSFKALQPRHSYIFSI